MVLFAWRVCMGSYAPALVLSWVVLARPIRMHLLYIGDVPSYLGLPSRRWRCWCRQGPGPRSALACTGRGLAAAGRLQLATGPAAAGSRPGTVAAGRRCVKWSWFSASRRWRPGAQGPGLGCGAAGFIGSRSRMPAEACGTELRHMAMACTCACGMSVT